MTRYAALDMPVTDPIGRELALVVVKGTFSFTGQLADRQMGVRLSDEFWAPNQAQESSIRWPSDRVIQKYGADVVVVGAARSAKPVRQVEVIVRAGPRRVHLRVHGERVFFRGASGRVAIGDAAPFTVKPIVYERAFGGSSPDGLVIERRNPVGRGVAPREVDLVDTPAPQIEPAGAPIKGAGGDHGPAGLGAIAPHWLPRARYAGTFDARWESERMPLMPEDFDVRFNNCAHPLLQLDEPLLPGTPVGIDGMSVEGPIATSMPRLEARVTAIFDDNTTSSLHPLPDTLVVAVEERRLELSCRATFPVGRGHRRLRALRVEHG